MRLILVAVFWVLGISLARHFVSLSFSSWLIIAVAAMIPAFLLRQHRQRWFAIGLAAFALGGLRQASVPRSSDISQYNGNSGTITGIVIAEPVLRDDRAQLRVHVDAIYVRNNWTETSGLALVETNRIASLAYGDQIRATGFLAIPATWDSFSYADYLARQGVFSIMRNAGIEVLGSGYGSPLQALLIRIKQALHGNINRALPEPQAGLLAGILLGDEQGISPELEDDFRRVGASHIIAISGFNMVVISAILTRVLGSFWGSDKTPAALIALLFIALYSLLVGAGGGILRAALMSSLLVIGQQLRRNTFVPTSLAFATLCLSLLDPNVLLDIGFQLSFFAVLGLGLFADPLSRLLRRWLERRFQPATTAFLHAALNEPLIVSIAAQLATLPLIVLYFGRLSLVTLPVNILIVPVQAAVLLLGLLAAGISLLLPVVGAVAFWIVMVFLSWSIGVVRGFAQFDFAEIAVNFDARLIQAYYVLLMGGAMTAASRPQIWTRIAAAIRQRRMTLLVFSASLLLLVLMIAMHLSRRDGRLHVWMLDMGHSNAFLLETPGGAQVLVDGGRFPSRLLTALGDRMPFSDREIEILAITHPDEWDIAALNSVLDRYAVGIALTNGQPNRNPVFQEVIGGLAEAGARQVIAKAGYSIDFGDGVTVEVLHPQEQPRITDRLSDHVLVLRVNHGDVSILLTSDLSFTGQATMLQGGISPQASVFQIPQHGTARAIDSQFLALAQPQIALLQSDIANRRGDPDPDTLSLFRDLAEEGRLFRTDEIGTIHLSSDGSRIQIEGSA
ncbi:MAG: ComEC/Rec2 family competence protein [Chloroflexota bacterium]|nr:ComEC/Rec2 family competence protein [Chloroflexota bacterium]